MSRPRGHGEDVAIRTSGLGKRYGATVALAGLDLAVAAGEVYDPGAPWRAGLRPLRAGPVARAGF